MEIEKKRETSWKIELKKEKQNIELTSVEISGEVRIIKLALFDDDNSIKVEMNKEEFFNFLSLISAFQEVIIGEDTLILEDNLIESKSQQVQDVTKLNNNIYQLEQGSSNENLKDDEKEDLNPEEWDPW